MNNADDNQDFYFDNKHFKDEQNVELNKPFRQRTLRELSSLLRIINHVVMRSYF